MPHHAFLFLISFSFFLLNDLVLCLNTALGFFKLAFSGLAVWICGIVYSIIVLLTLSHERHSF